MCALSFAVLAKQIKKFARVAAFDFRGHGYSEHPEGDEDLSSETLIVDAIDVMRFLQQKFPEAVFVVMGHSMGGSIACKATKQMETLDLGKRIVGLIVIDVVEGSAIDALPHMQDILLNKPYKFHSIEDAIKYT